MLVRDSQDAKKKTIKGRTHWYMDCTVCGDEYNVSPLHEMHEAYICPRCFYRGRWVYGR